MQLDINYIMTVYDTNVSFTLAPGFLGPLAIYTEYIEYETADGIVETEAQLYQTLRYFRCSDTNSHLSGKQC